MLSLNFIKRISHLFQFSEVLNGPDAGPTLQQGSSTRLVIGTAVSASSEELLTDDRARALGVHVEHAAAVLKGILSLAGSDLVTDDDATSQRVRGCRVMSLWMSFHSESL